MVILLVLMACGGDGDVELEGATAEPVEAEGPGTASESPEEGSAPVEEGGSEVAEPTGGGDEEEGGEEPPPRRRSVIAWLLDLGPSAPSGPSEIRAYEHLMTLDCAGLMERLDDDGHDQALNLGPSETLYRATGTACLAAFDGRSELWPTARELADHAGEPSTSCLDRATRRLLDDLLAAHDADPKAIFEPATGEGDAQAPPCPRIDRVVPDRGPLGSAIRIEGTNFHEEVGVRMVYGESGDLRYESLEVAGTSSTELHVILEGDHGGYGTVCIALFTSPPDWYADGRMFTLELPAQDQDEETAHEEQGAEQADEGAEGEADEPADGAGDDRPATTVACPPQL